MKTHLLCVRSSHKINICVYKPLNYISKLFNNIINLVYCYL